MSRANLRVRGRAGFGGIVVALMLALSVAGDRLHAGESPTAGVVLEDVGPGSVLEAAGLRAGYYLPQLLPIAVAGVVWGWILHPTYGVLNDVLAGVGLDSLAQNWLGDKSTALLSVMAIMVWFQLGYPIVIFMAAYGRIDPALHEAAELDGAGWFARFRYVTLPMIRPETMVVLLTTTVHALKVFAQVYVLTRGGPGNATNVPAYFAYQNFFERARVGYGAAIANVLTVLIVVIMIGFLRMQRRAEEAAA
jgi:raffinose/stachyose/melibiose transport system permease protein